MLFYCLFAAVAHCKTLFERFEVRLESLVKLFVVLLELVLIGTLKLCQLLLKVLAGLRGANCALPGVILARIEHDVITVLGLDYAGVADLSAAVGRFPDK